MSTSDVSSDIRSTALDRLRSWLLRGSTPEQVGRLRELLKMNPSTPIAAPACRDGQLDEALLRRWPRSAVAWLIYEIEKAPYNQPHNQW